MKKLNYFNLLILTLVTFSCISVTEKQNNVLTKQEIKDGWKLLFDGKSMDQWVMFKTGDPVTGWKVIDGEMQNSGTDSDHSGDIITEDDYENFELDIEWKINPQSNSGIFYHVQPGVTDAISQSGPEYQLIDGKGWPNHIKAYQYSGSNYAMQAPDGAEVKPVGEWNSTRIIVKNPHVEHWLNGKKVVEYDLWSDEWKAQKEAGKWKDAPYYGVAKTGRIGLQDHGGLTSFRNIKIRVFSKNVSSNNNASTN